MQKDATNEHKSSIKAVEIICIVILKKANDQERRSLSMTISVYTTTVESLIDPARRQMDRELVGDFFLSIAEIVIHKKPCKERDSSLPS